MPSNVFATTGTNVSVIFFDKSAQADKVILIDASKLGEEYKEGNNQKRRLRDFEIDKIVNTFQNKDANGIQSFKIFLNSRKRRQYNQSRCRSRISVRSWILCSKVSASVLKTDSFQLLFPMLQRTTSSTKATIPYSAQDRSRDSYSVR